MALTHAQLTSMFTTLAEVMGQDDAETLMQHLPPSGWNNVATKDDLRAGLAEINASMAEGFAQAATERTDIIKATAEGFAQAATERTDIIKATAEGFAQAATERADIRAQVATGLAEIVRRQAWHLYIVVSTIVLASVSIWIALLTQSGAGS